MHRTLLVLTLVLFPLVLPAASAGVLKDVGPYDRCRPGFFAAEPAPLLRVCVELDGLCQATAFRDTAAGGSGSTYGLHVEVPTAYRAGWSTSVHCSGVARLRAVGHGGDALDPRWVTARLGWITSAEFIEATPGAREGTDAYVAPWSQGYVELELEVSAHRLIPDAVPTGASAVASLPFEAHNTAWVPHVPGAPARVPFVDDRMESTWAVTVTRVPT